MSKTKGAAAPLLLALLLAWPLGCRRVEQPASEGGVAADRAADVEPAGKREPAEARAPEPDEEREDAGEREDDSEEAKEAAEEVRMRQRALEQLKAYRAKTCSEAIAKITDLLRTQKGRWLERNDRGQIPSDLVQTLTQAELWGAQSESLCKDDPARSHLDDLRNLMATIWQYPRAIQRQVLEERLRVLG